ncbi:MAG: exopolysaccharide biosynthesis polyprenyl glycosylphosphotransferase [Candidatus Limivicinus sp.]|nr:exopolysaccharide biosynthesis polyprenyl glycosylphosphotransferase [Candidatus Limivicinus sp.]
MDSRGVRTKLAFFRLLNIILVTVVFAAGWELYYNNVITLSYQIKGNRAVELLFLALYVVFAKVYDAFAVNIQRRMEQAISQALSALFADGLMYIVICLLYEWFAPVWPLMLVFAGQTLVILTLVLIVNRWYNSARPPLRAVLLHDGSSNAWHLQREMSRDKGLALIREMKLVDCVDEGLSLLEDAEVVFICAEQSVERDAVINYCIARKLKFFVAPSINDMFINAARDVHMFHMPLLQMHMSEPSLTYLVLKRGMDVVLSVLALLILWPFMLIIALAVKLYDGGPALYKQVRLTKDGEQFELLKFRSMRVDAEADGVARLSTGERDDRITPVGRVLRTMRLDELPQLLCILKGDMSIVGPRPERPEIAAKYAEFLPEFRLRLQAKAGLTGYAQVYGKYNSTPQEKLQMDLIYISNPSIIEDLKLILTTIRVLFIKESTEGVEANEQENLNEDSKADFGVALHR